MNNKKKILIGTISIVTLLALSIFLYPIYKDNQMKKLITISDNFFNDYIKKGEQSYLSKNMTAKYNPTQTIIVAGDSNEFVSLTFFEVNIDVNGEKDFVSSEHKMRIKKVKSNEYEIISQGRDVTTENLEFVYYSSKDNDKIDKDINNVKDDNNDKASGIEYVANAQGISLSFDSGENYVNVPIPEEYILSIVEDPKYQNQTEAPPLINPILKENTYYLSHDKSAFISTNQSDILITITDDQGESFYDFKLEGGYQGGDLFIGFSSDDVGYFAHTTDVAMGTQYNYIYTTTDGGKSFSEIGNTNEVYHRVVTGVGFIDEKIGFVGFRYESDNNPTVYRTDDSGMTWSRLDINLPYEYSTDYATPLTPEYADGTVVLPVKLRDNNTVINFVSTDKGLTWEIKSSVS